MVHRSHREPCKLPNTLHTNKLWGILFSFPSSDGWQCAQVLGEASSVIDFMVIHTYPLYWTDFDDYAKGEMDFQVRVFCLHGLWSYGLGGPGQTPSPALVRDLWLACARHGEYQACDIFGLPPCCRHAFVSGSWPGPCGSLPTQSCR